VIIADKGSVRPGASYTKPKFLASAVLKVAVRLLENVSHFRRRLVRTIINLKAERWLNGSLILRGGPFQGGTAPASKTGAQAPLVCGRGKAPAHAACGIPLRRFRDPLLYCGAKL
jgi:hypothetical protein